MIYNIHIKADQNPYIWNERFHRVFSFF